MGYYLHMARVDVECARMSSLGIPRHYVKCFMLLLVSFMALNEYCSLIEVCCIERLMSHLG